MGKEVINVPSTVKVTSSTGAANIPVAIQTIPSITVISAPKTNIKTDAGDTVTVNGTVNIDSMPSVSISGTPNVNATVSNTGFKLVDTAGTNTASVDASGNLSVKFPSAQSVSISNTPNVNATISGTPNVNISNATPIAVTVSNQNEITDLKVDVFSATLSANTATTIHTPASGKKIKLYAIKASAVNGPSTAHGVTFNGTKSGSSIELYVMRVPGSSNYEREMYYEHGLELDANTSLTVTATSAYTAVIAVTVLYREV